MSRDLMAEYKATLKPKKLPPQKKEDPAPDEDWTDRQLRKLAYQRAMWMISIPEPGTKIVNPLSER